MKVLLLLTAVACMATIGGSVKEIRCFECSTKSECEAIDPNSTPPVCNKPYVHETHEVRPYFDRCLRITDVSDTHPVYKRICGNAKLEQEYLADCDMPDCAVLTCYSDKCLI